MKAELQDRTADSRECHKQHGVFRVQSLTVQQNIGDHPYGKMTQGQREKPFKILPGYGEKTKTKAFSMYSVLGTILRIV